MAPSRVNLTFTFTYLPFCLPEQTQEVPPLPSLSSEWADRSRFLNTAFFSKHYTVNKLKRLISPSEREKGETMRIKETLDIHLIRSSYTVRLESLSSQELHCPHTPTPDPVARLSSQYTQHSAVSPPRVRFFFFSTSCTKHKFRLISITNGETLAYLTKMSHRSGSLHKTSLGFRSSNLLIQRYCACAVCKPLRLSA
jgi:hypothetical protein